MHRALCHIWPLVYWRQFMLELVLQRADDVAERLEHLHRLPHVAVLVLRRLGRGLHAPSEDGSHAGEPIAVAPDLAPLEQLGVKPHHVQLRRPIPRALLRLQ